MYCYQRSQYIRLNSKKNSFAETIWGNTVPYFSVHIRRTDKAKEAKPIDVQVYMQEIKDYFDILTAEGREITPKVFIATDEPIIIDEMQTKVNMEIL